MGKLLVALLTLFSIQLAPVSSFAWSKINKGIEHKYFNCENTSYHIVKLNPGLVNISSVVFRPYGKFAKDVISQNNADVVINGSFFTPEQSPIGLIISDGIQLSKVHKTSWWSIFYIEKNIPKISLARDISSFTDVSFAIQAGPRLIINESIPNFKNKNEVAPRSAIGIDKENNIFMAVSKNGITNEALAKCLMKKYPEGPELINAMNLDGGSSTQMAVRINGETNSDASIIPVPNFIIVKSKE